MRTLMLFGPYVLVPLFIALIFKYQSLRPTVLTYCATFILITFYPIFMKWEDKILYPEIPVPEYECPPFFISSFVIMVPICLVLQAIFNKIFLRKRIIIIESDEISSR